MRETRQRRWPGLWHRATAANRPDRLGGYGKMHTRRKAAVWEQRSWTRRGRSTQRRPEAASAGIWWKASTRWSVWGMESGLRRRTAKARRIQRGVSSWSVLATVQRRVRCWRLTRMVRQPLFDVAHMCVLRGNLQTSAVPQRGASAVSAASGRWFAGAATGHHLSDVAYRGIGHDSGCAPSAH